jgi:hypothetical protein
MRWESIQSRWPEFCSLAKRHWFALDEAQLASIGGRRDLLKASLQQAYGMSGDAAQQQIDAWCNTFDDDDEDTGYAHRHGGGAPPSETQRAENQRSAGLEMRRRTNPRD